MVLDWCLGTWLVISFLHWNASFYKYEQIIVVQRFLGGESDLCRTLAILSEVWNFDTWPATKKTLKWASQLDNICLLAQFVAGSIKHVLITLWNRSLRSWFPLNFTHVLFPLASVTMNLFTVINISHMYDYILGSVSLSGKSPNLGVVWGTLTQVSWLHFRQKPRLHISNYF